MITVSDATILGLHEHPELFNWLAGVKNIFATFFSRLIRFPGDQNIRLGVTLELLLAGCLANGFLVSPPLCGQFKI